MSWLPSPDASPLTEVQGLPQRLSPKASELFLNAKPTELGPSLAWLSGPPQLGRLPLLPLMHPLGSYTSLCDFSEGLEGLLASQFLPTPASQGP